MKEFVLPKAGQVTKPMAAPGLISYRYRCRSGGHVAIGARDDADAMREAARSIVGEPDIENLDVWNGTEYVPVRRIK